MSDLSSRFAEADLPGVHPAPNIQQDPEIYEIENLAVDPDQKIEAAMRRIAPWEGKAILDLGAGDGFHVPRFHEHAASVIAVEPHQPSLDRINRRIDDLKLDRAMALRGSAEAIPLEDHSVDIVHCRFAYFFGTGTETGLRELERVTRPGGSAFIIDNDQRSGTFASWIKQIPGMEKFDPDVIASFYRANGYSIERIPSEWRFKRREDFESVIRVEFPTDLAERIIRDHVGTQVDYHYLLIHRTF